MAKIKTANQSAAAASAIEATAAIATIAEIATKNVFLAKNVKRELPGKFGEPQVSYKADYSM